MYVLVAFRWYVILRNMRGGTTENLEQAWIRSKEIVQKHICRCLHCLHFNGLNSNKQYNWLLIVLLLFKQWRQEQEVQRSILDGERRELERVTSDHLRIRLSRNGPQNPSKPNWSRLASVYTGPFWNHSGTDPNRSQIGAVKKPVQLWFYLDLFQTSSKMVQFKQKAYPVQFSV